jgi:hypothetical protein
VTLTSLKDLGCDLQSQPKQIRLLLLNLLLLNLLHLLLACTITKVIAIAMVLVVGIHPFPASDVLVTKFER